MIKKINIKIPEFFFKINKKIQFKKEITNNFKENFILSKNFKFFKITNNLHYNFFVNYFKFEFLLEKKIIIFYNIYLNFLKKNKFHYNSSLNNFYNKNNLLFYKIFSKNNLNTNNFLFNNRNKKKHRIKKKFFYFKKNNTNFINYNFYNNLKYNKYDIKPLKKKKYIYNFKTTFLLISNIVFVNKKNLNSLQKSERNLYYFSVKYDLLYFHKNTTYKNFFQKVIKKGNLPKIFNPDIDTKILNLFFFKKRLNLQQSKNLDNNFMKTILFYFTVFSPIYFRFKYKCKVNKYIYFYKSFNVTNSNYYLNYIVIKKKFLNNFNLNINIFSIFKNIIYLNDLFNENNFLSNKKLYFLSNNFFLKNLKILDDFIINESSTKFDIKKNYTLRYFNNYYPIFYTEKKSYNLFMSKFKANLNINFLAYINFYIISFLENFFKKKIFLKISNNFFNKPKNTKNLHQIFDIYKNFQPKYMKMFLIRDFIEIIWYSFWLKDLTLISDWLCKFMEFTNFKVHKKFITFFQNFMNKHYNVFSAVFGINGFFFDIRGKVGVTGNSKKRHHFFKVGTLNRSTKYKKINFKQSVVRTPSGALGLTFIINY